MWSKKIGVSVTFLLICLVFFPTIYFLDKAQYSIDLRKYFKLANFRFYDVWKQNNSSDSSENDTIPAVDYKTAPNLTWYPLYNKSKAAKQVNNELLSYAPALCSGKYPCIGWATPMFNRFVGDPWSPGGFMHFWATSKMEPCSHQCQFVADVNQADAVVYHGRDLSPKYLNSRKSVHQKLVYLNIESPISTKRFGYNVEGDSRFRYFFNISATYQSQAEVHVPSGQVVKRKTPLSAQAFYDPSTKKTGASAYAAISNCNSNRMSKVNQLKQHFPITVYGSCTGNMLPWGKDTFKITSKKYRFYLSFENSLCKEYITEKFFNNALLTESIPVVFGSFSRQDYEKLVPAKSFIYAMDFSTSKQLGDFLINLANNETEYASYFSWRLTHQAVDPYDTPQAFNCNLCKHLYDYQSKVEVTDLERYYSVSNNCRPPSYTFLTK